MKTESSTRWRHLASHTGKILKGHPFACLFLALTLAFATVTIRVLAQQSAVTPAEALELAITLYDQGEVRQAQPLFAAMETNSPVYGTALAYDALCRYEICRTEPSKDYSWFLKALNSPALQPATLPEPLREDLAFKELDARYQSHLFGGAEIMTLTADFQKRYPGSAHAAVMAEYELVAWFERGMQRLYGACMDETKRFHKTWTNGVAFLEQFLSLTKALPGDDYVILKDRSLAEDTLVALALMSKEPGALMEIPVRDAVNRQRYGLIRVTLQQKLQPEAWEQNLQLLADATTDLQRFPASRDRARMKRELARFAFRTGERFCAEAAGTPPTDVERIAAKRAVAGQ
jgi:hypothetical protein